MTPEGHSHLPARSGPDPLGLRSPLILDSLSPTQSCLLHLDPCAECGAGAMQVVSSGHEEEAEPEAGGRNSRKVRFFCPCVPLAVLFPVKIGF